MRGGQSRLTFEASFGRSAVAQMKIAKPDPGARLIGGFLSEIDFVGLRLYRRDELPFRRRNNGTKVIDYRPLVDAVMADWEFLLPGALRLHMASLFSGDPT